MHQLLDHFEEAHVVALGGDGNLVYPVVNDNTTSNSPTFTSAPANALTSQPGWPSMVVGYPQPYPPADAPFHYPPPSIDTNFLLPAQQQAGSFSSALEGPLDLDLDFDSRRVSPSLIARSTSRSL